MLLALRAVYASDSREQDSSCALRGDIILAAWKPESLHLRGTR